MATGSYLLGSIVKIPIQLTINSIPNVGYTPIVEKIIKPSGVLVEGLPQNASVVDEASATYYYAFTPDLVGDYIVIIKYNYNGQDYYAYENFTVSNGIKSAPRAEPK
jgi:hypothetical protein